MICLKVKLKDLLESLHATLTEDVTAQILKDTKFFIASDLEVTPKGLVEDVFKVALEFHSEGNKMLAEFCMEVAKQMLLEITNDI